MRLLLHACCGVCLAGVLSRWREETTEVVVLFYNPNIHPLLEFRRRMKAVHVLRETEPFEMIVRDEYGLAEFLTEVEWEGDERCASCYQLRLGEAAREAQRLRCDAFATTMTISTHQDHTAIRRIGEACGDAVDVPFLYRDFRDQMDMAQQSAKREGLYRQAYCGCIFSEYERYRDTTKHLYRGAQTNAT